MSDIALGFAITASLMVTGGLQFGWYKVVASFVQIVTLLNVFWLRSILLQDFLHTLFVGLMVYGSFGKDERSLAVFCNGLMLILRVKYDKCVFLWWNNGRNPINDVLGVVLLVGAHYVPLTESSRRLLASGAAIISHFAGEPR